MVKRIAAAVSLVGVLLVAIPGEGADVLGEVSIAQVVMEAIRVEGAELQAVLAGPSGGPVVARLGDRVGRERAVIIELGRAGVSVEHRVPTGGGPDLVVRQPLLLGGGFVEINPSQ